MLAGERRHCLGNGGHPRAQGIEAVTPVVAAVSGVDGAAGGELCSGRWPSGKVIFLPRQVPVKIEQGEGYTRRRGSSWWREWRGGGPGCAEQSREAAVAGLAGVRGDSLFLSN